MQPIDFGLGMVRPEPQKSKGWDGSNVNRDTLIEKAHELGIVDGQTVGRSPLHVTGLLGVA